jgi:hypothetical protein
MRGINSIHFGCFTLLPFGTVNFVATLKALSDSKQPRGSLTRDEFFVACKLVALKQHAKPATVENLDMEVGLPSFAAFSNIIAGEEENPDDEIF